MIQYQQSPKLYGKGYSSMLNLQNLSLLELKLDNSPKESENYIEIKDMKQFKKIQRNNQKQRNLMKQLRYSNDVLPSSNSQHQYIEERSQGIYYSHYGSIYKDQQLKEHLQDCKCGKLNSELEINEYEQQQQNNNSDIDFGKKFKDFKEQQQKYKQKLSSEELQLQQLQQQQQQQQLKEKDSKIQSIQQQQKDQKANEKKRSILKNHSNLSNLSKLNFSFDQIQQEDQESQEQLLEHLKEKDSRKKSDSIKHVCFESDYKKLHLNYMGQNCRQLNCNNNDISVGAQSSESDIEENVLINLEIRSEHDSDIDLQQELQQIQQNLQNENQDQDQNDCIDIFEKQFSSYSDISDENPSLQSIREFPCMELQYQHNQRYSLFDKLGNYCNKNAYKSRQSI